MTRMEPIAPGIREAHDRIAGEYGLAGSDGKVPPGTYAGWLLQRDCREPLERILRKHLAGGRGELLDAGCGNGQISRILLELGVERVLGVDFSARMLHEALRRLRAAGLQDRFRGLRADLQDLGCLPAGRFEAALLFGVLEHLDRPDRVLSELLRVVRPAGHLVVSVPIRGSVGHLTYLLFGRSPHTWGLPEGAGRGSLRERARYYRFYSRSYVPRLLAKRGGARIVARLPFARFYLDGCSGAWLHRIAARPDGYRRLDGITRRGAAVWRRPGAEYLVIRKDAA